MFHDSELHWEQDEQSHGMNEIESYSDGSIRDRPMMDNQELNQMDQLGLQLY